MGMDLMEILMRIEDDFDVDLSDDDLSEIVRDNDIVAGDLCDLIQTRCHMADIAKNDVGLNFALWGAMQRAIATATDVPLKQVQLKTTLESLFPRKSRRHQWDALRASCPLRIPELEYPRFVRISSLVLAGSIVLAEQLQLWQVPGAKWLWVVVAVFGLWAFAETYAKMFSILSAMRMRFPKGMVTVKDLCRSIVKLNYLKLTKTIEVPVDQQRTDAWPKLAEILVDILGVNPQDVTRQSRLVADLGMT